LRLANGLSNNNASPQKSKYYSYKTFKRMGVPAIAYSAVANVASRLLQLKPEKIPVTTESRRRVALVTGSNTGVGYESAKTLVQDRGFEVIIACRSAEKGTHTCKKINEISSSMAKAVFVKELDLSDLQSVRDFSQAVNQQYETIEGLINNGGRNSAGPPTNGGSLDVLFQTNFLGHFLLTNLLLEKCQRIVNLGSVMHHFPTYSKQDDDTISSLEFWRSNAMEPSEDTGSGRKTYAPSKLAAILFSLELNRRFGKSKGIRSIAVNPGSV
jgi:NAD(P)-dependent dehydrogenase (short-subunit alcohol dehydrogenase family)